MSMSGGNGYLKFGGFPVMHNSNNTEQLITSCQLFSALFVIMYEALHLELEYRMNFDPMLLMNVSKNRE
ncbi:hypothetical Protein YC6258_02820 [Gynuella sunshinyii YC6258]|uniref:Uncharacterized protein n=1 Tax=Gynuella sunshinyii YC6258 TaxID=1445510 RepID=A0A0C5VNB0_9GAMM|nr:hypothetical Protein YC6258_02820 [Gynuella sunshinyii YC6258]